VKDVDECVICRTGPQLLEDGRGKSDLTLDLTAFAEDVGGRRQRRKDDLRIRGGVGADGSSQPTAWAKSLIL
jgi:hypothetical protein